MSEFRFEDPPPPRHGRHGEHIEAAQKLREKPGQWAIVTTCVNAGSSSSMARAIRVGARAAWKPAGDFDAVARRVDGEYRVYARYLPDPEPGNE
ncbi:hypothetical protein ACWC1C_01395 [Streptomyces sp. NPDC001705]